MIETLDAQGLAEHLDAINRRVEARGPTKDAEVRMAKVMASHEAACAALRRAEAEGELDAAIEVSSAAMR